MPPRKAQTPPPRFEPTARWTGTGVWAVWDASYAQRGVYMSELPLRGHLQPGQTFPPAREDGSRAQVFDNLGDAVKAWFVRTPRSQKVEVWR